MKFMISSLFLAFLVVAANAASLEKGEKIDELSGPTAHEHEHEHALKTAPAEVVEAKSGEISGAEVPVGHLKSVDSEKSEQSERVCVASIMLPLNNLIRLIIELHFSAADHHFIWSIVSG